MKITNRVLIYLIIVIAFGFYIAVQMHSFLFNALTVSEIELIYIENLLDLESFQPLSEEKSKILTKFVSDLKFKSKGKGESGKEIAKLYFINHYGSEIKFSYVSLKEGIYALKTKNALFPLISTLTVNQAKSFNELLGIQIAEKAEKVDYNSN
ncbi:MAG: hypothetical protein AB7J46_01535 [Candidatus Altimarinota bacterium]